ncbi:MAG: hypothetical protein WCO25_05675 [Candidatus Uhrbacteria bacterium]
MTWKEYAKMFAALAIITIGFGCWWWLNYEGYTGTQRVIIVNH